MFPGGADCIAQSCGRGALIRSDLVQQCDTRGIDRADKYFFVVFRKSWGIIPLYRLEWSSGREIFEVSVAPVKAIES